MAITPCYKCEERHEACWGSCERFIEYDKKRKEEKFRVKRNIAESKFYDAYALSRCKNKYQR